MTMENKYSPLPTWRLLTLLPPRISLISKRNPPLSANNQNFTYMENFQLLISLSEDILVLFSNDDNYMRNLDDVWETLQKQDPDHFRDVQLRILISHLAAIQVAFLNTFGGHMVPEADVAISQAWHYAEEHMSPQYRQGL